LPTPTIGATSATLAEDYFGVNTWTGNGTSQTITNSGGFQPDWVWTKTRNAASSHRLTDSVRGVTQVLYSDGAFAEGTEAQGLLSFNTNGFTAGSGSSNQNGTTYVGWQWKAGGTAVSNTAGSVTSTVSANTTSGFSIVTWTGNGSAGQTVGHGLGVAPSFYFLKQRNGSTYGWVAYHSALGANKYLLLNTTNAGTTDTDMWNNTAPTSSVFSLSGSGGNAVITNPNTGTMVAYCFAPVAGYSAFGSYTGNGSVDGPFVYTGFRPKYIMRKDATTGAGGTNWYIIDTSRAPYNASANVLAANQSYDEATFGSTNYAIDILSNGFRVKDSSGNVNASGNTYIYAAFAEFPFKYSLAR
jgi:hypothetical protein